MSLAFSAINRQQIDFRYRVLHSFQSLTNKYGKGNLIIFVQAYCTNKKEFFYYSQPLIYTG